MKSITLQFFAGERLQLSYLYLVIPALRFGRPGVYSPWRVFKEHGSRFYLTRYMLLIYPNILMSMTKQLHSIMFTILRLNVVVWDKEQSLCFGLVSPRQVVVMVI